MSTPTQYNTSYNVSTDGYPLTSRVENQCCDRTISYYELLSNMGQFSMAGNIPGA